MIEQSYRIERKFLIAWSQYHKLKQWALLMGKADSHAKMANHYPVQSLYFDTFDLKFFLDSQDGLSRHNKVRIRCYERDFFDSDSFFLETKSRERDYTYKQREKFSEIENWQRPYLWQGAGNFAALKPQCFVYYEREAYYINGLKINFDKNLQYSFQSKSPLKPIKDQSFVILELKASNHQLISMVPSFEFIKTGFSKYNFVMKLKEDRNYGWDSY